MKYRKSIFIFLLLFLSLSLGAVTVDKGGSVDRYMGLELTKNSGNIFRVTSFPTVFNPDQNSITTEQYREWVGRQPTSNLIHFDNVNSTQNPEPVSFQIVYYFETPGTMFVFFSSKSDLGYKPDATRYDNPHMLESIDGPHFINYNINVDSWFSYYVKSKDQTPGKWQDVQSISANYGNKALPSDHTIKDYAPTIIDICPFDAAINNPNGGVPVKPIDPTITSGVVFRRKVNEGGIRGADTYTLSIKAPQASPQNQLADTTTGNKLFSAGFYNGYVVVHYTSQ